MDYSAIATYSINCSSADYQDVEGALKDRLDWSDVEATIAIRNATIKITTSATPGQVAEVLRQRGFDGDVRPA